MSQNPLDSLQDRADEVVFSFSAWNLPFSNFSAHQIHIWGEDFPTSEHAYQYKKFVVTDPDLAERIKRAKSPYIAKQLSLSGKLDRTEWDSRREAIMREILEAKLTQHEDIRMALAATGDKAIIQKTPDHDQYWGIGQNNEGRNTMGMIWMWLRSKYHLTD